MRKILLLGIDFGTGGCKVTIINGNGDIVAEATEEYPTHHPKPHYSEQDPEDWFKSLISCLNKTKELYRIDISNIEALSIDASTHNAVLLDGNMNIIRPTIMWTDQRSVKEVDYLEKNWGSEIYKLSYHKVAPTWTLPQLLWIKNNEPANFSKIKKIMFVKDYIRYKLTGGWETDYIDAQGTLLFDMEKRQWSEELCKTIDLDINVLPPICSPTDIVGNVTNEASRNTDLKAGTPVLCGTSDSAIEDYGAGAIRPGQCILKLATAGNVNVMTDLPNPNPLTLTYSHVIPGMWYTVSATNTAASAMRWFRDNFCYAEMEQARKENKNAYEIIEGMVSGVPAGSKGLIFHPYLLGERAPYWDPYLRASFIGATMNHKRGHFLRALMEGVAFSLRDCYRVIEDMKIKVDEFILIGGGSRSELWSQIICDVFGSKIIKPVVSDASFGSAIIAGVGIGVFSDLKSAIKECTKISKIYNPDPKITEKYSRLFRIYLEIHKNINSIYKKINKIMD